MFDPPCCPYDECPRHLDPVPGFARRRGHYKPRCRNRPVPRFKCRSCRRTFSRQTFRVDYRQKKPYLNATFLQLMVACVGLRQAARVLGVARRTVEHRFHWLAGHSVLFHRNRIGKAFLTGPFQLDEMESFELNRFQPVTVPILIDRRTFGLIATSVGPLRRKGRLSKRQKKVRNFRERRDGRRPSQSNAAVQEVLSCLVGCTQSGNPIVLESDKKSIYGTIGRRLFGERFNWKTFSATSRRDRLNPLFPINHTNARLRHFLSRLRRRTWCVSKRRAALGQHLAIATLWVNYCRGITNRLATTPAQALGWANRGYRPEELLGWREDWVSRSPALALAS